MSPDNRKKQKKQGRKKNKVNMDFKEKLAEVLELPKEVVLDVPKITMIGNSSLVVENYKGIVEYGNERIRVNTAKGLVKIQGDCLTIREITSEDIVVMGKIGSLEFME
ncbi:MAG: sporulation protein YqfC [Firmicutes bacterium]|nr:sporulation protein YqfC [Bacillota bacterium]